MAADLSKLSDADLAALKSGDLSKVSTEGLTALKGGGGQAGPAPKQGYDASGQLNSKTKSAIRGLGEWGSGAENLAYKAGGKVTDVTGSPALGAATNLGIQAVPMMLGGEVGKLGAPAMQSMGRSLMSSALKPDKFARESGDAAKAIETLLQKGYNVTEGGVEKMTAAIDKLDEALDKAISTSKNAVSTTSIIKPIKDAIAKFKDGLDHAENTKAIKAEVLKFFDHPEVQGAFQIPVQTAQKIKQAIYREAGDKAYGFGQKPMAQLEGKKAIARGLNEGLGRAEPEAAAANREMGPLINARDLAQNRVMASANRDPLSFGVLVDPAKGAAWLAQRNPFVQSVAGRGLYSGAEAIPRTAGQVAGGVLGMEEGQPPQK